MLKTLTIIFIHFLFMSHSLASCINRPVSDMGSIEAAVEWYRLECSSDPVSIDDLISRSGLVAQKCNTRFLLNIPIDPWGEAYRLLRTSAGLYAASAGPDSTWKSSDDIVGIGGMQKNDNFKCEDLAKMTGKDYLKQFASYGAIVIVCYGVFYFRKRLFRLFAK